MSSARFFLAISLVLLLATAAFAERHLHALPVDSPPTVDGKATEAFWQQAQAVTVHDRVADIDISLRAAHDGSKLYLLVQFPDPDESRSHRAMVWNPQLQSYENGPSREDCFVVKWSMSGVESDLTLTESRPYRADIWYWKAHRTDHAGYADDKMHIYSSTRNKKAKLLLSDSGKVFYLQRNGDQGEPAYKPKLQVEHTEDTIDKYEFQEPSGSRADVRAKGSWQDGRWTLEFARKLQTGNSDDLQMELSGSYRFGVSRYEIAGREPEPESEVPLFGAGEVGEVLVLSFQP